MTGRSVTGAITRPQGFRATAMDCGIKPKGLDLALLVADWGCTAGAVFTTNRAQAAPVLVSRDHVADGKASHANTPTDHPPAEIERSSAC